MSVTPEQLRALLRKPRWSSADLQSVTGWSEDQVYRWRKCAGLRGRWTYLGQIKRLDALLWEALQIGAQS